MNDRVSTYPGRVRLTPVEGQTDVFDMTRADSPTQEGTALNKANLLSDTTASAINTLTGSTPSTPNSALYAIANKLSAVITSLLSNATATAIQTLTGTKPTTADGAFSALTGELSTTEGRFAKIEAGSYAGTGTFTTEYVGSDLYAKSRECSITCSFVPKVIWMYAEATAQNILVPEFPGSNTRDQVPFMFPSFLSTEYKGSVSFKRGNTTEYNNTPTYYYGKKSADGKTFYWYSKRYTENNLSDAGTPYYAFDASNTTYYWIAIG